ncbi:septum formation family protein, partial [Actinoplanes sp. NPDC005259]
ADVAPAAGTPGAKAAYRDCSDAAADFLGGPVRGARVAVQVVWPTRAGWAGGARWFRCDVTTADLDGRGRVSRTGSLAGELTHASPLRLACFDPEVSGGTVTAMTAVACGEAHRAEFAGLWTAPDISYARLESDTGLSAGGCRSAIARFAGLPDDSELQFRSGWISYNPTRAEWLSGERLVRCFIYFSERTFNRSLKNAGPGVLPVR